MPSRSLKKIALGLVSVGILSACTPSSNTLADLKSTCLTQTTNPELLEIYKGYSQTNKDQIACPQVGDRIAIIETDLGTIKMKVFDQRLPLLSKNFLGLIRSNKYTDVPFHRVVKDFMIQTGDFTNKDGTGGYSFKGPDQFLPNEIDPNYQHLYGTVSMAKTADPVSIGSQFFIVTNKKGTSSLDGDYSPIGQVYEGMDVAEAIADLQVPGTEKPSKVVNIKKITTTLFTANQ